MTIFYWTDTELDPDDEAVDWTVGEEVAAEEEVSAEGV